MSLKEILEELPKLTEDEKRQLWNVLKHELTPEDEEESPEFLAELDERERQLDAEGGTYTIDEVREHIHAVIQERTSRSRE
jgi:hypothetical protein